MCPWTGRYEDTFFYLKSKFILKLLLYYLKSLFRVTEQRLYMPTAYNIMPFNTL